MLIFGRLLPLGEKIMSLDLPDDGDALKSPTRAFGQRSANLSNVVDEDLPRFFLVFFDFFSFVCHSNAPFLGFSFRIISKNGSNM